MVPRVSILVPAHNEAAVIGATITPLRGLVRDHLAEIIVVANACTDETAERARAACPEARVLETPIPGKTAALNLAFRDCRGEAIVCLDADLDVTAGAIRALAAPILGGEADASCGRMHVDVSGASRVVRLFYAGWALNPYHDAGKFGGVFAMSRSTALRLFPLPSLTADDEYVSRQIPSGRVAFLPEVQFTVHPPRSLAALLAVRKRVFRGTRALCEAERGRVGNTGAARIVLRRVQRMPRLWPAVATYFVVILAARLAVLLERTTAEHRWERDETSRMAREVAR